MTGQHTNMSLQQYRHQGSTCVSYTYTRWHTHTHTHNVGPTLYHVAIKAGLYCKAVQVYHIPKPGDILPLQLEIRPWISRSPRITWNETKGVLCTHVGYLRWAPNVTGEKMEITFFPDQGSNPGSLRDRPTLYHVTIGSIGTKAVQLYHIPIPGDIHTQTHIYVCLCVYVTGYIHIYTHYVIPTATQNMKQHKCKTLWGKRKTRLE